MPFDGADWRQGFSLGARGSANVRFSFAAFPSTKAVRAARK